MEAKGSHFDLPNDDTEGGEKKSTHLELQEKYGGENVTVSIRLSLQMRVLKDLLKICPKTYSFSIRRIPAKSADIKHLLLNSRLSLNFYEV
jgi:hypothetical protein